MGCGCSSCPEGDRPLASVQRNVDAPKGRRNEEKALATQFFFDGNSIPTTRLLFVRHAQAEAKSARQGEAVADPGLSATGLAQAEQLAARWRNLGYNLDIVCSPMQRCLRTAAPLFETPVAKGRRVLCHALLCEHGNNPADFSPERIVTALPLLKEPTEFSSNFVGFDISDECTLSRATQMARWIRDQVREWYRDLPRQTLAIVSHQTILDCLLRILLDGTGSEWAYGNIKFKFANTGVYEVLLSDKGAELQDRNSTAHLK
mmetsp:Transcript_69691/g.130055  ORF Transcript_69691/g.130055 Transcript_69691/m.130055 type:complete len:261 (+) Transcript_69691:85-867(+)